MIRFFFLFLSFFALSCSSGEDFISESECDPIVEPEESISKEEIAQRTEIGKLNAVKKAYQLTDILFTPLLPIEANTRTYDKGKKYKGMIYSSVKELGTYVGSNVSFHTFMTAVHNPRSKIYTEKIDTAPYHGTNCKAYYGTVCSGLVSYALGLDYASYDFPASKLMVEVSRNEIDSVHVADVLWTKGHVALVTNVVKDEGGHVTEIEVSESIQSGCKRYSVKSEKYVSFMTYSFNKLFRYTELYKNVNYTSVPEFVAVLDETPVPFVYNDDICLDKGDKACYLEDEDVTLNIMHYYEYLEIYKDNELFMTVNATSERDVALKNLHYGDYKARICYGDIHDMSDYTYWKVVNIELTPDRPNRRLYFKSANAKAYSVNFGNINGARKNPFTKLYSHTLTENERLRGFIEIPKETTNEDFPFVHFRFSTEYGNIESRLINWFKE